jgi:hypothetical protein
MYAITTTRHRDYQSLRRRSPPVRSKRSRHQNVLSRPEAPLRRHASIRGPRRSCSGRLREKRSAGSAPAPLSLQESRARPSDPFPLFIQSPSAPPSTNNEKLARECRGSFGSVGIKRELGRFVAGKLSFSVGSGAPGGQLRCRACCAPGPDVFELFVGQALQSHEGIVRLAHAN